MSDYTDDILGREFEGENDLRTEDPKPPAPPKDTVYKIAGDMVTMTVRTTPKAVCICGEINARHCQVHQKARAREWILRETADAQVWASGPRIHPANGCNVIEKSAYLALEAELAHMTEKFERNSIAAGEYSLQIEEQKKKLAALALDRDANNFLLTAANERAKGLADALEQAGIVIFRCGDNSDSYTHRDQLMRDFKATKEALLKYKGEL